MFMATRSPALVMPRIVPRTHSAGARSHGGGRTMLKLLAPRSLRTAFFCLSVLVCQYGVAEAAARVALLIGNEKYEATSQLNNPANDVDLMKTAFEQAGFDSVTTVHDVDRAAMVRALRDFEDVA